MRTPRLLTPILLGLILPTVCLAADHLPHQICCVIEGGADIEQINQQWGTTTLAAHPQGNFYLLSAEGIDDVEALADQMSGDPAVCTAGANYHIETPEGIRMMVVPAIGGTWDDYQDQSLTERIGLEEAHQMSRGSGVLVAVLDTGIDPDHVAFEGRISPNGYDFIEDDNEPWDTANGLDDDGDGTIDEGFAHGTMVAGIVALVAPEATILPIRVLNDEGLGTVYSVTRGILYAHEQGADVYNMSFGIPTMVPTMWPELQEAADEGVIFVSGAGNENREEPPYYPAIDPLVYMVTALDTLDTKADFADFHDEVIVSAPGVGVRSAYPGNEWGLGAGCSFAIPFVAGEAALILQLATQIDQDGDAGDQGYRNEVEDRIREATDEIYDIPGNEEYDDMLGTGRIFLPAALYDLWMDVPTESARPTGLTCFPNPSLGQVVFRMPLRGERALPATVAILDANGRIVRRLPAGPLDTITWNGRDGIGNRVPAGLYWARPAGSIGQDALRLTILR